MRPIDGLYIFVGFMFGWFMSKPSDFWIFFGGCLYIAFITLAVVTAETIVRHKTGKSLNDK